MNEPSELSGDNKECGDGGKLEPASHFEAEKLVSVPDNCHRVGLWALRHQSFPFSKKEQDVWHFLRFEVSPFLNIGPNSLKTHLRAKPNISEGRVQFVAASLQLQLKVQR